jgi:DnaJ-domain-containing protein 1
VGLLLAGVGIALAVVMIGRWLVRANPADLVRIGTGALLGAAVLVVVVLVLSGRLGWVMWASVLLLPWLMRLARSWREAQNLRRMRDGGASGRTSRVDTRFLAMRLDHDSGALDGRVREGRHAGCDLGALELDALLDLLADYRIADEASAQVLEAYLDRTHDGWRDHERAGDADAGAGRGGAVGAGGGAMTRDEAYAVLGLEPGADETQIKAAYHRLIAALHPDRGGSNYLAAKINEARRILTGR